MSKMLTMEDLAGLRGDIQVLKTNVSATEFSLSIEYLNGLLDTLEASLKVVEAAKELILGRTAPHNWKGDPQKMVYQIERKALVNLMDALAPFREEKEPRT